MPSPSYRVLVVDDNRAIHDDFKKVLGSRGAADAKLADLEAELFGVQPPAPAVEFVLDSAFRGEQARDMVRDAVLERRPYALAFVDMRMPPGWDGLTTTSELWGIDSDLQIVIATAYSDHSWQRIVESVGQRDNLIVLKKPFADVEVQQIATAMCAKWRMGIELRTRLATLRTRLCERKRELEDTSLRLGREVQERKRIETELHIAQRLEAVAHLAAGIAHEINTPIQFTGDCVYFLRSAFDDLLALADAWQQAKGSLPTEATSAIERAETRADLAFLRGEIPQAFTRAQDGLARVAKIVSAMKEFAHPGDTDKAPADLNKAIQNTLVVAHNEYKYVADVEIDLGDIPSVPCMLADLNQVFLNLVVNAAHAIADATRGTERRGKILIRTFVDGDHVVISIGDDGCGIPESSRGRIFDPFFTTKPVGRGTGQGLAIARSVVVDKHGGRIGFDTEVGHGTTFFVHLPLGCADVVSRAA